MRTIASLVLVFLAVSAAACGSSSTTAGSTTPDPKVAERYLARVETQLARWRHLGGRSGRALKRQDWASAAKAIKQIGRGGELVRLRFGDVPPNLRHGESIYRRLVAEGDAAGRWELIWRDDPPPYGSDDRGIRKAQRLADAANEFIRADRDLRRYLLSVKGEPITK